MRTVLAFAILTMCVSAVAAESSLAAKKKQGDNNLQEIC
jgi:hypothetical protein